MKSLFNRFSSPARALLLLSTTLVAFGANTASAVTNFTFTNSTSSTVVIENVRWRGSYYPQFQTTTPAAGTTVSGRLTVSPVLYGGSFSFEAAFQDPNKSGRCYYSFDIDAQTGRYIQVLAGRFELGVECSIPTQINGSNNRIAFDMRDTPQPDFLFDAGTLSPATTSVNGTVNIDYSVTTVVAAPQISEVGVFLTDDQFNALLYFGEVPMSSVNGSDHSIALSFDGLGLTPGNYNVVLFADVNDTVVESNENNNLGAFAITLVEDGLSIETYPEEYESVEFIDRTPSYNLTDSKSAINASGQLEIHYNN